MHFERVILAIGAIGVASAGVPAFAQMNPLDAISVCSRISKKNARLECYDQVARDAAAGRLAGGTMPSAPPPNWAAPPAAAPAPAMPGNAGPAHGASGFGAEDLHLNRDSGPESIQAQVVSSSDNGLGRWRMTLADGSIWLMTESVSYFRPPKPNEVVTIRKGALGSFLMDVGKQAGVRVTRVR